MFDKKRVLTTILAAELTTCFVVWGANRIVKTYTAFQRQQIEQFEREQQTFLDRTVTFWQQKAFDACLEAAQQVSSRSRLYNEAQQIWQYCQNARVETWMNQARAFAEQGRYQSAIHTVNQIPRGHPQYETAQQLVLDWSIRMLTLAQEAYQQATAFPNEAIAILSAVPEFSPLHAEAKTKIAQWQQDWNVHAELARNAIAFLDKDRLSKAKHKAEQIGTTHPYWKRQRVEILDAIAQRQAEKDKERQAFWHTVFFLLLGGGMLSFACKRS